MKINIENIAIIAGGLALAYWLISKNKTETQPKYVRADYPSAFEIGTNLTAQNVWV